ncbi:hypothetical protein [Flavobacterium sp. 1355]|uniref:hypothetical protein n=1 Tax=Flavobacterium sp. 1355 TaxID=2806571 RepID=UPI001AE16338|nr:hypothetical protein [Flavobacterium sp. 1355]MBP1221911.1 hypothetical protein [Flavobacterium sp. 1355]
MLKLKIFLSLFLLITFYACDKLDDRELLVKNNSDKTVYSIISENDSMYSSGFYYEYQEGFDENKKGDYDAPFIFQKIRKGETAANHDRPRYWDNYFNRLEDKQARLFIIQKDSVDKYGWKTIFKKNSYSKKYLITIKQLDSLNWTIEYNGKQQTYKG